MTEKVSHLHQAYDRREFMAAMGIGLPTAAIALAAWLNDITAVGPGCLETTCMHSTHRERLQLIQTLIPAIISCAGQYGISPAVLASTIYQEGVADYITPNSSVLPGQSLPVALKTDGEMQLYRDIAGLALHPERVSLGIAQVTTKTANKLEDKLIDPQSRTLTPSQRLDLLIQRLLSPWWNMAYASLYIAEICRENGIDPLNPTPNQVETIGAVYNGYSKYGQELAGRMDYFSKAVAQYNPKTDPVFKRAHLKEAIPVYEHSPDLAFLLGSIMPVDYIIFHHTAVNNPPFLTALDHMSRGWGDIGYHAVVGGDQFLVRDGHVYVGRSVLEAGAHTLGFNRNSLGIAVNGNFEKNKPTTAQLQASARITRACSVIYCQPAIVGHKELDSSTVCPGKYFPLEAIRV